MMKAGYTVDTWGVSSFSTIWVANFHNSNLVGLMKFDNSTPKVDTSNIVAIFKIKPKSK